MRSNCIPLWEMPDCTNDRPTDRRVRMPPWNWHRIYTECICMCCKIYIVKWRGFRYWDTIIIVILVYHDRFIKFIKLSNIQEWSRRVRERNGEKERNNHKWCKNHSFGLVWFNSHCFDPQSNDLFLLVGVIFNTEANEPEQCPLNGPKVKQANGTIAFHLRIAENISLIRYVYDLQITIEWLIDWFIC